MVKRYNLDGYEAFNAFMTTFEAPGRLVHIYFGGSKYPNGKSWCGDCNRAWEIIEEQLQYCDPKSIFISVQVGDYFTWKDPNNPFRRDPRTNLLVVPTIIRWNSPQRLEGYYCEKVEIVQMLLNGEE